MNLPRDGDWSKIGPRIPESCKELLADLWGTTNKGAEWVLHSFSNLYRRTMLELEGRFTHAELDFLLDVADLVKFYPELAGSVLLYALQDRVSILSATEAHPNINVEALTSKVRKLSHYHRYILEIWMQHFRCSREYQNRGDHIARLCIVDLAKSRPAPSG